jgi:hypothetical protein
MQAGVDRILTSHVGSLPRPPELTAQLMRRHKGEHYDRDELERLIAQAVEDVVARQAAVESGYPGFVTSSWWGVAAPAGLPEDIAARLEKELLAVAHSPEFHKSLAVYGFTGDPVGRAAFAKRMESDLAGNTSIVEQLKAAGRFELSAAKSP